MVTGARGEGILELDGEQYAILLTNRALADAERMTDKSILQLLGGVEMGTLRITDVIHLLTVGLEYARKDGGGKAGGHNTNDAWRLMDGLGFTTVAKAVYDALKAVLNYDLEEKEEKASPPE
ncbi:MAG: GTA-gp10 family protein [Candidatus Binatia bacterium]|nr:GTA-gp10 family protein [Candidatus Binatia bacterium]